MTVRHPESFLRSLFDRAVEVADPVRTLADHLPPKPVGRVVVVGAGKASARMAEAVEAVWGPCEGLVITRYGHHRPCSGIEVVEAAHPVPDEAGRAATERMLELLSGLGSDDFVLALISGGASALLVAPAGDISLAEKQQINESLLASGAPIDQMNVVRKHLSRVKGGQLAAAAFPAQMLCLMISDVPGDEPSIIGSGPTVGEPSTPSDAANILKLCGESLPNSVVSVLEGPSNVVQPDDLRLSNVENRVYAAPSQSLKAASEIVEFADVTILGDDIEGEAREVARAQSKAALDIQSKMFADDRPVLLLSGGELTVTRRGNGSGGPNAEFCLAMAIELKGNSGIHAIACDTDGIDGAAEVAGAIVGPETLVKAEAAGLDPMEALDSNDAHSFFKAIDSQVVTGPTLTNVNDFRGVLIYPS